MFVFSTWCLKSSHTREFLQYKSGKILKLISSVFSNYSHTSCPQTCTQQKEGTSMWELSSIGMVDQGALRSASTQAASIYSECCKGEVISGNNPASICRVATQLLQLLKQIVRCHMKVHEISDFMCMSRRCRWIRAVEQPSRWSDSNWGNSFHLPSPSDPGCIIHGFSW